MVDMLIAMMQCASTALLSAAWGGHVEALNILLDKGADILSKDVVQCLFLFCCFLVSPMPWKTQNKDELCLVLI